MRTAVLPREQVFQGPLILVNRDHPVHTAAPDLAAPDPLHPEIQMERQAAALLRACMQSIGGGREIVPVSGWRSQAEQQAIWDGSIRDHGEAFTRRYVARPGCSEHQTGLAMDLGHAAGPIDFLRPAFPYDGICGAFRKAAVQYGFIQRYTREKEDLTGISQEPWHFRYVGAPHAQLMDQYGLCLEEYAGFLRTGPTTCRLPGGRCCQVFYVPCQGTLTQVQLPDGCWQVSGDNADGFIVTVWGKLS